MLYGFKIYWGIYLREEIIRDWVAEVGKRGTVNISKAIESQKE